MKTNVEGVRIVCFIGFSIELPVKKFQLATNEYPAPRAVNSPGDQFAGLLAAASACLHIS
jgi:hypothetical protein